MTQLTPSRPRTLISRLHWVLFPALLGATSWLAAQGQPATGAKKDDKKGEIEEGGTRKLKKVIGVDDPPGDAKGQPDQPAGETPAELARAAEGAAHKDVKQLFLSLSNVHDRVTEKNGTVTHVQPLTRFVPRNPKEDVTIRPVDKPRIPLKLTPLMLAKDGPVEHFEDRAVTEVDNFLRSGLDKRPPTAAGYLSRADMLAAGEKALTAALNWHNAARERKERAGPSWDGVRGRVMSKLYDVQVALLQLFVDSKEWDKANAVSFRLLGAHPENPNARGEVITLQVRQADETLQGGGEEEYKRARAALTQLEAANPALAKDAKLNPLRDRLRDKAGEFIKKAREEVGRGQPLAALAHLNTAEAIAPEVKGLRELRLELKADFPVLYVGVPSLPDRMSPAAARTDAERWAVELLFESLVQAVPDPAAGRVYRPQLAESWVSAPGGAREFVISRSARWGGEGAAVTAADVSGTLDLLRELAGTPVAEPAEMLTEQIEDSHRLALRWSRGLIDPFALADFKVLPVKALAAMKGPLEEKKGAADLQFARNPVGSGPYRLRAGTDPQDEFGRRHVVFEANPAFNQRPGMRGKTAIREIRFVVPPTNPAADFKAGRLHLLLDVPTADVARLREPDSGMKNLATDYTVPTRRVWMLAINHRVPALRDRAVRQVLTHAVNREQILTEVYRAGNIPHHRALTGPFPPDSWACPPGAAKVSLDRPETASGLAAEIKPAGGGKLPLRLAHVNEPRANEVCRRIKQQVEAVAPMLDIQLNPTTPEDLFQRVKVEFNYDIAYCPHDYRTEQYNLASLLDPAAAGRGGRNFLGYGVQFDNEPDRQMVRLMEDMRAHRDPAELRRLAHEAHKQFNIQVPFVPLWQLDFHLVVHRELKLGPLDPGHIDPQRVFIRSEEWTLR